MQLTNDSTSVPTTPTLTETDEDTCAHCNEEMDWDDPDAVICDACGGDVHYECYTSDADCPNNQPEDEEFEFDRPG